MFQRYRKNKRTAPPLRTLAIDYTIVAINKVVNQIIQLTIYSLLNTRRLEQITTYSLLSNQSIFGIHSLPTTLFKSQLTTNSLHTT